MQRDNDDDAWRAIVENYGDRADLDPEPAPEPAAAPEEPVAGEASWDDPYPDADWSSDRFVPPPPPPVPATTPDRMLAWAGLFGAPAILLVCLVAGIDLPPLLAYLLVAAFVGGFLYLVLLMPRGPRDPDDDGAVV
ncbi:hypothetical protein LRP67_11420 [Nocardioides sp. cx-169]|uniref:hypothetical protein n=1 Tax=Nocardioides sp. cx-169 TaxID=2899080 RepID=UPI001E4ADFD2|nr:hypothetical protein [Nocardioides sp. cx-169]MCD4534692.1 hypothetical protein [Nocardioides sp. cx-169]